MSEPKHIRIGDMLVRANLVSEQQLKRALQSHRESGRRLGEELVALGFLAEAQLTQILSNQLSVPWVSLYHIEFSRELLNLVPAELAHREKLIPVYVRSVRKQGDTLFVAMDDPTNQDALEAVSSACRLPTKPMIAPPSEIMNTIRVYYFGGRLPGEEAPAPAVVAPEPARTPDEPASAPTAEPEAPKPAHAASRRKKATRRTSDPPKRGGARRGPKMVTLTLLDGTTVRLPSSAGHSEQGPATDALTATDLISALLARAQGADVSDVLPNDDWETLFATLLRLLIRKGLIADWEFVDELEKLRGE